MHLKIDAIFGIIFKSNCFRRRGVLGQSKGRGQMVISKFLLIKKEKKKFIIVRFEPADLHLQVRLSMVAINKKNTKRREDKKKRE